MYEFSCKMFIQDLDWSGKCGGFMPLKKYLVVSVLVLASCQPFINSRGNVVAEQKVDSFIIGKTTMSDVLRECGTPSLHKNDFTWIYIGGVSEEISFKSVNMKNKVIIKLIFDQNKILREKIVTKPKETEYSFNPDTTNLITDQEVNSLLKGHHE